MSSKEFKRLQCPKCGREEYYISNFTLQKRICLICDADEINKFVTSKIFTDEKGTVWQPTKGNVLNRDTFIITEEDQIAHDKIVHRFLI